MATSASYGHHSSHRRSHRCWVRVLEAGLSWKIGYGVEVTTSPTSLPPGPGPPLPLPSSILPCPAFQHKRSHCQWHWDLLQNSLAQTWGGPLLVQHPYPAVEKKWGKGASKGVTNYAKSKSTSSITWKTQWCSLNFRKKSGTTSSQSVSQKLLSWCL